MKHFIVLAVSFGSLPCCMIKSSSNGGLKQLQPCPEEEGDDVTDCYLGGLSSQLLQCFCHQLLLLFLADMLDVWRTPVAYFFLRTVQIVLAMHSAGVCLIYFPLILALKWFAFLWSQISGLFFFIICILSYQ